MKAALATVRPGQLMPPIGLARLPEWITCRGAHREVVAGGVQCGLVASTVSIQECLACHHLGNTADERGAANWCTTTESDALR